MSEWLTTGAMIDRLKVGEVAEIVEGKERYNSSTVKKDEYDRIVWVNDKEIFQLTCSHSKIKWRILPKYVTFEEAMQALKDDKTVTYHDEHKEGYTFDLEKHWNLDEVADYTMEDLFKERWTIEG